MTTLAVFDQPGCVEHRGGGSWERESFVRFAPQADLRIGIR